MQNAWWAKGGRLERQSGSLQACRSVIRDRPEIKTYQAIKFGI